MSFINSLFHRLHQTSLSRWIRRSPTLNHLAGRYWIARQSRMFFAGLARLGSSDVSEMPMAPPPPDNASPLLPDLWQVIEKRPEDVIAGEDFASEMALYCSTSKFLSCTQRKDSCGYQDIYAQILPQFRKKNGVKILEIGIGVSDPSARSGMASDYITGASLAGWAGYFKEVDAEIHGADVDPRCMHESDQYTTHLVNQLDIHSLEGLSREIGGLFDIVVDDGLHTPEANVNVMSVFLPLLAPDGVMVVEDIPTEFDESWFQAANSVFLPYKISFFPSRVLRQHRGTRAGVGIAIITRL